MRANCCAMKITNTTFNSSVRNKWKLHFGQNQKKKYNNNIEETLTACGSGACCSLCLSRCLYLSFWRSRYRSIHTQFILNGADAQRHTGTCLQRIIFSAIIIGVKEFFKPLQKLKIILKTTFDQFINGNYLNGVDQKRKN